MKVNFDQKRIGSEVNTSQYNLRGSYMLKFRSVLLPPNLKIFMGLIRGRHTNSLPDLSNRAQSERQRRIFLITGIFILPTSPRCIRSSRWKSQTSLAGEFNKVWYSAMSVPPP